MSGVEDADVQVIDLVRNFARACRALVPHLDQARVPWADCNQYDNWDRIAEPLFESLVLKPCRFQAAEAVSQVVPTTARYGFLPSNENAFVCITDASGEKYNFIQLLSRLTPFDHCEGFFGGQRLVFPMEIAEITFVLLQPGGTHQDFRTIGLFSDVV